MRFDSLNTLVKGRNLTELIHLSSIFYVMLEGLFHPSLGLPLLSAFSWPMKMEITKANQEPTRARNAG